jgi:hypothetical protein
MTLVPLKEKKRPTPNSDQSRAGVQRSTPKVGAIDLNRPHPHSAEVWIRAVKNYWKIMWRVSADAGVVRE